jgi:hypothetical protein
MRWLALLWLNKELKMPVIENKTSGVPDNTAVTIARLLTASPDEYRSHIVTALHFSRFIWTCFFRLIEDVGYVPQPTGSDTKKIVCFVPFGPVNDPFLSSDVTDNLSRALRSVGWRAEVEQHGKKLLFKLEGVLSATDVPVLDKRCILPSPVQFSYLMRPENEALTRLIWSFGDNILRSKKTFTLGAEPRMWLPRDVQDKGVGVYVSRGWLVRPWEALIAGRKTHFLDFTLPSQKALPAPGKAL